MLERLQVPSNTQGIELNIDGFLYRAHRLAFIYMTGDCPPEVDHKDRNRSNNSWSNLRVADHTQNMQNRSIQSNNKSGCPGVYWDKRYSTWRVQIDVNGKRINICCEKDLDKAIQRRKDAIAEHFKAFASF